MCNLSHCLVSGQRGWFCKYLSTLPCLLMFHVNQSWPIARLPRPLGSLPQTSKPCIATMLWLARAGGALPPFCNMLIIIILPSSSSLSSLLASLLSFLSCRSISALIRFCSCCSSERQHAITAAAIHSRGGWSQAYPKPHPRPPQSTPPPSPAQPAKPRTHRAAPRRPPPIAPAPSNGSLKDYGFEAIQAASAERWQINEVLPANRIK